MFWIDYFTSSKIIHKLIEVDGLSEDIWEFEIRKTFDNEEKAKNWEMKVLNRIDAAHHDSFINASNSYENFGFKSDRNPMKNIEIMKINHDKRKQTMLKRYGVELNWKTKEHASACSKRVSLNNSKKIECPHCGLTGGSTNMKRYHFNNCKRQKEI